MKRLSLILSLLVLFIYTSNCQYDKYSLFESLTKKYKDIKSVSFQFYSVESAIKGSLKAATGNKYSMTMPDRTVVCDGTNIWNYSKQEKKVVISQFEENTSSFSIDNFFFSFLNGYKPVNYYKENSSAKGLAYVLEMEPISKSSQSITITKLKLWLDTGLNIQKVEILTPQSPQTWEISNFQINPSIAKKVFQFTAPKDCEVIDLR